MRKIDQDNYFYQKAIKHESKQWGIYELPSDINCDDIPMLYAYKNEALTGDPQKYWVDHVIEKYGPFKKGCALGCGSGRNEWYFGLHGGFESFAFYDVSKDALLKLKGHLSENPNIHFEFNETDLNFFELPSNHYDLILCSSILHHLVNLEHILFQISNSLTPNGILVLDDYIGETRFQWNKDKLNFTNSLRELFRESKMNGSPSWKLRTDSVSDVVEGSSFEAIRSSEIPQVIDMFFPVVEEKIGYFPSSLFLWGVNMTDSTDNTLDEKIRFSVELDKVVTKYNLLPPMFLYGIFKKQHFDQKVIQIKRYTAAEIKALFCESIFTKRKIRALLLSNSLTSWFYDLLRKIKRLIRGKG